MGRRPLGDAAMPGAERQRRYMNRLLELAGNKPAVAKPDRQAKRDEAEFNRRVQQEVTRHIEEYLMPHYKEKLEKAEMVMRQGKPFTNAQYLNLLRAVHPDSSHPDNRQAAFILLKEKEVLLRPEEKDKPLTSTLPTTLAELLARKRTKTR